MTECDRIANECDRLLDEALHADVSIDNLHLSAGSMRTQIAALDAAQTRVDQQRRALSKKLFWFKLRPSQLLASARRSTGTLWRQPGGPKYSPPKVASGRLPSPS